MRRKLLLLNTVSSLVNQLIVAICGLILPRLILMYYGSEVNGLLSSITQFLGLIAFLELGVGAVVQSTLYKPLAEKDNYELSKIIISAENFFKRIAQLFLIYVVGLVIVYPLLVNRQFDIIFTGSLVIILSISSFVEYYFGIVNQLFLNADQKSYIHLMNRSLTQILNLLICIIFIYLGFSIHIVKLTTALIFSIRPIYQWYYVKKNYRLDYSIELLTEPIKQKWNGLAQHIAAVVLDKTDMVILTTFSTLSSVSVYSVYYLVVNNLRQLVVSGTIGIQSLIGNIMANKEQDKLKEVFELIEIITHLIITFLFTVCGCLIIPFVKVYTMGIVDTNYIVPLFAILITLANAFYSLRNSYNMVIKAAGHYKETQNSAIIEVIINVIISLVFVVKFGLTGVAIGTLVAMLYRTLYLVFYLKNNILFRPVIYFFKNIIIDIISAVLILIIYRYIYVQVENYFQWFILALEVSIVSVVCCVLTNLVFYRGKLMKSFQMIKYK